MTRRAARACWPAATPTEPTPDVISQHCVLISDAVAEGRVAEALDLLDGAPPGAHREALAKLAGALLLPAREDYNELVGNERPVPPGMLVAVDLGDGLPLVERAGLLCWGPGLGPNGEGRVLRWARIEGAGRPN